MRKITKIKRSIRAISPVISVLLMIAIAVVASLVAYAWIMGYLGGTTTKSGNAIQIQNYVTGSNLIVYVQNTGQGIVHLKQDGSVYVNDVLQTILRADGNDVAQGQLIPINVGQTVELVVNCPFNPGDRIKIVTVEGTFMQITGNSGSSSDSGNSGSGSQTPTQVTVTFTPGSGGIMSPSGPQTYTTGTIIPISATANTGYVFSSWTFTGSIQINNPTSASTTATINGAGTVTANFISAANPRLALTAGTGQTILVSSVSSIITIQRQDSSGNPTTTGTTTVTLATTSSTGTFYSDSGGTTKITSITLNSPASSANIYYEDTSAGTPTLTASATGYSSVSTTLTINSLTPTPSPSPGPSSTPTPTPTPTPAPPASKLVFTAGAGQSLTIGDVSPTAIVVQRQDSSGNPVSTGTSAITVSLSTTSSNGKFYSDSAGTNTITQITIAAGSSNSAGFYYKDTSLGTPTLTASYSGLTSATTQFTINNYQLVYTNGVSQSLSAGTVSQQITIQRQDQYGNSYRPSTTITIQLTSTSSSGKFYSDSSGTTQITSVSINSGSSSSSNFYYKDSGIGSPTLTGSCSGYASAQTTFTITGPASQLGFTAGASQSLYTNQVSSVITVTREDTAGNAVTSGGSITVNLAKTSSTGSFYNNAGGTGSAITSISIASGSSSANFYYKDTGTGSSTITASYTGLTSATTTFTITQNYVNNAGFESSSGGWTTSTSGGSDARIQSGDNIPPHSGNFAEIATTSLSTTGNAAASLKQTFTPAILISSIPNTAGSFSLWVYNNGAQGSNDYYSFQITITASDGSQLIYYWGSSHATPPTASGTVKVINMGNLPGIFTVGQWVQFTRNLSNDWTSNGLSSSATIASIVLQSNGYRQSSSVQYGQELFLDDVKIQ